MKILLLGKNGQVGWELQRSLAPLGELIALDFDSTEFCADFTKPAGLVDTVRAIKPDVIVNAAAHTAVDKAESESELARTINATAPGVLAQEAQALGALLVHFSTDYVFDGRGSHERSEKDATGPLNTYGLTKLEGEQLIADSGCRYLTFRTSWVYGARGGNFAKTMLKLAAERDSLNIINDQIGAPTGADLLADVTAHAIRSVRQGGSQNGIYHLVASGETSWYDYACLIFDYARAQGAHLKLASASPVPTSAYPTPAKRPLNSRLDTSRLCQEFDLSLPDWKPGVLRMLEEIGAGK